MQGVDKQSDSDRLCLHSLFSNRPTQSHQWGAHMHANILYGSCALTHTRRNCQSLSHLCTDAVTHSVFPAYLQTHINTLTTRSEKGRWAEERGLVLNAFLLRLQCWGNGAIMTRDERATMVSSLSLMFHCTVKKEASSILIRLLGKTCRALYRKGSEWGRVGETGREKASSPINQWTTQTHIVDTSAADIDDFDGTKTIVCIDLEKVPVFCFCLLTLCLFLLWLHCPCVTPYPGPMLLSSFFYYCFYVFGRYDLFPQLLSCSLSHSPSPL